MQELSHRRSSAQADGFFWLRIYSPAFSPKKPFETASTPAGLQMFTAAKRARNQCSVSCLPTWKPGLRQKSAMPIFWCDVFLK
jgi:hypothetical protein